MVDCLGMRRSTHFSEPGGVFESRYGQRGFLSQVTRLMDEARAHANASGGDKEEEKEAAAIYAYTEATRLVPYNAAMAVEFADYLARVSRPLDAEAYYRRVLEAEPRNRYAQM